MLICRKLSILKIAYARILLMKIHADRLRTVDNSEPTVCSKKYNLQGAGYWSSKNFILALVMRNGVTQILELVIFFENS